VASTRQACRRDLWIGVATVALGTAYLYGITLQVSAEVDGAAGVSGRTLPYLAGGLMVLLGAALALTSWNRSRTLPSEAQAPIDLVGLRRVLAYILLIAAYAASMATIGYVVSTACALLAAMKFSGAHGRLRLGLITVVTPALLYGFFIYIMKIPLPDAWLF